jgi:mercuric reductase
MSESCCSTNSEPSKVHDLLIIGGGSAAFAAAIEVSTSGGSAVIFNEGLPIGGTCVNVGCVPSKALIRAAEANHRANSHDFEGIDSASRVTDFRALTAQTRRLVEDLRTKKYIGVISGDENIVRVDKRARLVDAHTVEADGISYSGKNILIATGARPAVPPIEGIDSVAYLTNEELYELEAAPSHLIVIGGRYIGLENAQMMARLGVPVTLLQRSSHILPDEATDLTEGLRGYLEAEGVRVHTSVAIQSVRPGGDGVVISASVAGSPLEIEGSHVFLATGRRGNTDDIGLEALGIEVDASGYLAVDENLLTGRASVFGAGDVLGTDQFVYTAAYEGRLAARNAMGNWASRDYSVLPWVVFTDPQLAGVGMDETQAAEAGIEVDVSVLPLDQVPRSIAARDTRGFIKLIRNRATDTLVGARILAPEGSELLMEVALAIRHGITVTDLRNEFHPYLTLAEGIKLAAITFDKSVEQLSCCAV